MLIFRFTTSDGSTVRLDLNDPNAWHLSRGFILGTKRWERTTVAQPPFPGIVVASAWAPPVQMSIPLLYGAPGVTKTPTQIRSAISVLRAELERSSNTIEMREPNDTVSFLIDVYGPNDVPSLHQGQASPNPFTTGMNGFAGPITLELFRAPDLRGAGAHV